MKALVLCGGIPQIALIKEMKSRGIITVLADMNEKVEGRKYADIFYPVSTLDVDGIEKVAVKEKVDFIITVCADQVLQVVAEVSEKLKLPCYINFVTAENVSKKSYMKKIFVQNEIPTSKYIIAAEWNQANVENMSFPLIVKPVDSYSSKGVKKVTNFVELKEAFETALNISRTKTAIIEEFVEGKEITVDVYIENGKAYVLCMAELEKINDADGFVIYRTKYPAELSKFIKQQIQNVAQKIADVFNLKNSPMLIQLLTDDERISVVEFCARTGGGDKFRLIEKVSGFNVVNAVLDLTLGRKPHVAEKELSAKYIVNEFLYCNPGVFEKLEGFERLLQDNVITEYYQLKQKGTELKTISSSGDRVAYFTVEDDSLVGLKDKYKIINNTIKVISNEGKDILRHDLLDTYNMRGK